MDFDVFISRSSLKHHRGFSHSILFATILSLCLAAIAPCLKQDFLKTFFLAALSSHSHLLLDFSTTWLIPVFFPLAGKSSFELDTAVNPLLICSSLFWLVLIALSNRALFSLPIISIIAILLLAFYLFFRYFMKQIAYRRVKGMDGKIALIPTFSPFKWRVLSRYSSDHSFKQKIGLIELISARYVETNTLELPYSPEDIGKIKSSPPLNSERDAILFSASIEQILVFISKFRYTNAVAKLEDGIWKVFWSAEEAGIGIEAHLRAESGEVVKVKMISAWRRS